MMVCWRIILFFSILMVSVVAEPMSLDSNTATLERVGGLMHFQGIPYSGIVLEHFESGVQESKTHWAEGKREGLYESWHSNGRINEQRLYIANRKEGEHRGWYSDGGLRFLLRFQEGAFHGRCEEWYPNGDKYSEFNYEFGKEIGPQKLWEPNGKIRANYVVKEGKRYGIIGSKQCVSVVE